MPVCRIEAPRDDDGGGVGVLSWSPAMAGGCEVATRRLANLYTMVYSRSAILS